MAGGKARLLHYILQRLGMTPDEVMQKPRLIRMFIFKSMEVQLEAEAEEAAAIRRRQQEIAARGNRRGRRR